MKATKAGASWAQGAEERNRSFGFEDRGAGRIVPGCDDTGWGQG